MKKLQKPDVDPTLPNVSVKLKGKAYALAFTFASLAVAERKLAEQGIPVNIFAALDFSGVPSAAKVGILLYAALQPQHPELTYFDVVGHPSDGATKAVEGLLTMANASRAYAAICKAYAESMAEPDEDDSKNE